MSSSAATCESIDCVDVFELYQQPATATFCKLFVCKFIRLVHHFIVLRQIQIFHQNLSFVAEHHVYKYCCGICNDVILMP